MSATTRPPADAGGQADEARPTSTSNVSHTAKATKERRRLYAGSLAYKLGVERLDDLDDEQLVALTSALVAECLRRGVSDLICAPVPEKRRADRP